jgi:hypothetical protein
MMPRAPEAPSIISWALGLSTRHFVMRPHVAFAFQPRSVRQPIGYLSHRGDRPTYPEPSERLLAVTASEHPIGATGGLELGIVAVLVQHQMRAAVDVLVREHRVFLALKTICKRNVV